MDIPLAALDARYEGLRAVDPTAERLLLTSMDAIGQRDPVLVVQVADAAPVLIDGFRRLRVARRLKYSALTGLVLPMSESDALLYCHQSITAPRRTALEEGWLLRTLVDDHRIPMNTLAEVFGRTTSWISRRLAMVQQLPDRVQDLVRSGALSAHSAMRSLVPMARANSAQCEQIAEVASREKLSSRDIDQIYCAWRCADSQGREAIATAPMLALRAYHAIRTPDRPRSVPETELTDALTTVSRACIRARRVLLDFVARDLHRTSMDILTHGWKATGHAVSQLDVAIREVLDARS